MGKVVSWLADRKRLLNVGALVSGRGSNLQALMDECAAGHIDGRIGVVISDNGDAFGLQRARKAGIPAVFLDPAAFETKNAYNVALAETLKTYGVDLVCLAGYMRIVRKPVLDAFDGRILNIHPSLLPSFPGLDAQAQALAYGVKVAGCTVHFVTAGMDEGPIVLQATVPVLDGDSVETLSKRILEEEHRIYPLAVQLFASGRLRIEGRRVIVG